VRSRLLATVNPERQSELRYVLARITKAAQATISRDYTEAQRTVESMQRANKLNEAALLLFAISNRYEHVTVALALLCGANFDMIDRVMRGDRVDALLVPCKAAGLEWATARAILKLKSADGSVSEIVLDRVKSEYSKLSISTASRVLRFWLVHENTTHEKGKP
jgi:hypothetical protein